MTSFDEYWKRTKCKDCTSYYPCRFRYELESTRIVISECPYYHKMDKETEK